MKLLLKRTIICSVAAVAVGAALTSHSEPQKVKVYTSTNPTNYDPGDVGSRDREEGIPISQPHHRFADSRFADSSRGVVGQMRGRGG